MVGLSFDVEMWRCGISTVPLPQDVRDEIEAGLRARLLELVAEGTDVVLDFSFWSRRMRDDYRRLLEPTGVVPETFCLATDRETVLNRVRARSGSHADDFVLTEELAGLLLLERAGRRSRRRRQTFAHLAGAPRGSRCANTARSRGTLIRSSSGESWLLIDRLSRQAVISSRYRKGARWPTC